MAVSVYIRLSVLIVLARCSAAHSIDGFQHVLTAADRRQVPENVEEAEGSEDTGEPTGTEPETALRTCGVSAIQPNVSLARVVGGQEATKHSWPWMVSLQNDDGFHFCGGSLINNQWILSAAHCGFGMEQLDTDDGPTVVLGLHKQSETDSQVIRVKAKVFVNEKYDYFDGGSLGNDVMLMKLEHPVEFNDFISPVCLPTPFKSVAPGTQCYLTGWGTMWFMGHSPDELMQVKLEIIHRDVCNKPEWYNGMIDDTMVCAGISQGGAGACHGDSGGPLVCLEDGQWVQYGVVSWGFKCSNPRKPANFARVSAYRRWMEATMHENAD